MGGFCVLPDTSCSNHNQLFTAVEHRLDLICAVKVCRAGVLPTARPPPPSSHGNWCVVTGTQGFRIPSLKHPLVDGNRMRLNNLLQSRKSLQLTWQTTQTGPAHQPTWQAVAFSAFLRNLCYLLQQN